MAAISSIAIQIIAAIVLTGSATAQISSGYATYSNGGGGVCSGGASGLPAVSMNAAQFANGAACGQCIQITGSGNGAGTSPVSTAPYVATINNVCPQCSYGDIDLQESGNGKYGISWSFVGCPGAGRKLIESPFLGDTTVYTGFAHMGQFTAADEAASAPQQAAETVSEGPTEQQTEEIAPAEAETEVVVETSEQPASEPAQEPTVEAGITKIEETSEAPHDHLEAAENSEEVLMKTSRRLLMTN